MPLLLLIRHGENEYVKKGVMAGQAAGVHLNEKGRAQAGELAEALKDVPIAAIYSSPLERAVETATPIAKARGVKTRIRRGLIETDIGAWQGMELKKVRKLPEWKLVQGAPSRFRFPDGESFTEQQVRVVTELEAICKAHKPEEVVACVFHADPIKLAVAFYLGMPLDHFQRIAVDTGSVTILFVTEHSAMLVKQNLKPPFKFPLPKKKKK
jgi:probable phosphomutase (TIGR03848 family)